MSLTNNISSSNKNKGAAKQVKGAATLLANSERRIESRPARKPAPRPQSYVDNVNKFEASTYPFYHDTYQADGVSHINISADAKTDLGAGLNLDYELSFHVEGMGEFGSLTAFHFFITRPVIDDSLRMMSPRDIRAKMRQIRQGGEPVANPTNYRYMMLEAMMERIHQYPGLKKMLVESKMRFECYFPPSKSQTSYRHPMASWLIPGMEIIRNAMRGDQDLCTDAILMDFVQNHDDPGYDELNARPVYQEPKRSEKSVLDRMFAGTAPKPKQRKKKSKAGPGPISETVTAEDVINAASEKDYSFRQTVADFKEEALAPMDGLLSQCLFKSKPDAMAYILSQWGNASEEAHTPRLDYHYVIEGQVVPEETKAAYPHVLTIMATHTDFKPVFQLGDFSDANPYVPKTSESVGEVTVNEDGSAVDTTGQPFDMSIGHVVGERTKMVTLVDHADQPLEVPEAALEQAMNLAEEQPTQA